MKKKINPSREWYVLYVKSRHERKIETLLRENNIETFLPLVKTVREWSDRKKIIESPLFPSYLFVKINFKKESEKVLAIRGFCFFVRFGVEFAKIQEHEINSIKLLMEIEAPMIVENNETHPQVGEHRKIEVGALCGLGCEVIKVNNENKIIVRIDSMNQNILATIPSSYLTPLAAAY